MLIFQLKHLSFPIKKYPTKNKEVYKKEIVESKHVSQRFEALSEHVYNFCYKIIISFKHFQFHYCIVLVISCLHLCWLGMRLKPSNQHRLPKLQLLKFSPRHLGVLSFFFLLLLCMWFFVNTFVIHLYITSATVVGLGTVGINERMVEFTFLVAYQQ